MSTIRKGASAVLSALGNMMFRNAAGNVEELDTSAANAGDELRIASGLPAWSGPPNATTGFIEGGSITLDTTTSVDVAAGKGFVANYADPDSRLVTPVPFGPFAGVSINNITTTAQTLLAVNSAGALVQFQDTLPTFLQRKQLIILGVVIHPGVTIIQIDDTPQNLGYNGSFSADDYINALGPTNISGNDYSANGANLNVDVSIGVGYFQAAAVRTTPQTPDLVPLATETALTMRHTIDDGSGGETTIATNTVIDPDNFDDGTGVLAAVPAGEFTIQHFFRFSNGATTTAYGQETFATLDAALVALGTEDFSEYGGLPASLFRGRLIVQEGATDLTDLATAQFFEAPKFRLAGVSGGSSTASLMPTKEQFFNAQYSGALGDYRTRSLGGAAAFEFSFDVPHDFTAIVALEMVCSSVGTIVAQDIDLTSDYGADGESITNHSESDTTTTYSFTAGLWDTIDISGVFSSLAAGDRCGIEVNHNTIGTTIHYLGVRLRYV